MLVKICGVDLVWLRGGNRRWVVGHVALDFEAFVVWVYEHVLYVSQIAGKPSHLVLHQDSVDLRLLRFVGRQLVVTALAAQFVDLFQIK